MKSLRVALALAFLAGLPDPSAWALTGSHPESVVRPTRFAAGELDIAVDGRLDEAVWAAVPFHDEFSVIEPDTLASPVLPTRVQFLYTDDGLYVGVTSEQDPATLVSRLSPRDGRINRDSISITIDPSGEGLYGYWFSVSLGGSLSDGTVVPEREFANQWDGPWAGNSAETGEGWTAEFFLPWSMMAMPASGADRKMAFYISRKVAYLDERWSMPALPTTKPRFLSVLRPIALADVQPKPQLTFYPFSAATLDRSEGDLESRIGADVFWRPNSNLQLSATLNPDFGTIEQDDLVVNLSAFENFFSEKRAFFLEGQEVFVTSPRAAGNYDGGPPVLLVNTRRVGAPPELPSKDEIDRFTEDDRIGPTDLFGAGKVTGQIGSMRYGVLAALEEDSQVTGIGFDGVGQNFNVPGRAFGAVRGLWESGDGGGYRGLGGTLTMVGLQGSDAYVGGIDGHLLTADGRWKLDSQALLSQAGERTGLGMHGDLIFTPERGITHTLGIEAYDDELDINDFGFLRRNDQVLLDYGWRESRSNMEAVRQKVTSFRVRKGWNLDGKLISSGLFADRSWTYHDLSEFSASVGLRPERWDDRNSQGNGAFRVDTRGVAEVRWRSNQALPFAGGIAAGARHEDLGGLSLDARLFFTWRPSDRIAADVSLQYKDRHGWLVYQENRDFTTFDATELRPRFTLDYFFSARQQIRATMQWVGLQAEEDELLVIGPDGDLVDRPTAPDGESDDFAISNLVFQLRYRWEIAPLSDLFVVYTRGGNLDDPLGRSFTDMLARNFDDPDGDQLVVKLRYRLGA